MWKHQIQHPPHNSLHFSLIKYSYNKFTHILHVWHHSNEKTSIKGTIMQDNVIYALKPEKLYNMKYKRLNICY